MMARGELLVIVGNMASRKSDHLISEAENRRNYGDLNVAAFKPTADTRSGEGLIKSRNGREMKAFEVRPDDPAKILEIIRDEEKRLEKKIDLVVIDEVQFFPISSGFCWTIDDLLSKGYDVLAAGLALNFRGEPFGSTLWLATFAGRNCILLHSICTKEVRPGKKCGRPAIFPQRFLHSGELAPYNDEDIAVGSEDRRYSRYYEPRCYECFERPAKKD